jgi:hypothetical protein
MEKVANLQRITGEAAEGSRAGLLRAEQLAWTTPAPDFSINLISRRWLYRDGSNVYVGWGDREIALFAEKDETTAIALVEQAQKTILKE